MNLIETILFGGLMGLISAGLIILFLEIKSKMKFSTPYKLMLRIISLPFIFGILFVTHNLFVLKRVYMFFLYGGEFIQYSKDEAKTIKDVYDTLKKK